MRTVPSNRLLFWVGILFLPFTAIAAVLPDTSFFCYSVLTAFFLLSILDILLSRNCFNGFSIALPAIIRMTRGRDTQIDVHIHHDHLKIKKIRLGLVLPRHVVGNYPDIQITLPHKGDQFSFPWPCRAFKRGRYRINRCCLETPSPLGFWFRRTVAHVDCEIRVYPNLLVERQALAAFFIKNNLGIHSQYQIGKGRDFEQLREYLPGDSFEDIHWKATAKRRFPISKIYQIERTQNIYVIIDASRLGARNADIYHNGSLRERRSPSSKESQSGRLQDTILERFITAALTVGMAAEKQGDNFGVAAFSDHTLGLLHAKSGRAHYQSCRDMLYLLETEKVTPDFTELFTTLSSRIRKRSLLLFLTSLDDPTLSESFLQNIDLLRRRHLIMVNMLKPASANPLFSVSEAESVNDLYHHLSGHFLWESLQETAKTLQRMGTGFTLLDNEKMCPQLITQYLNIKKRQLL